MIKIKSVESKGVKNFRWQDGVINLFVPWLIIIEDEGFEYITYLIKLCNNINPLEPLLIYRFSGKEIYPYLDNYSSICQKEYRGKMNFNLAIPAIWCEEKLRLMYPDYTVKSIKDIEFFDV